MRTAYQDLPLMPWLIAETVWDRNFSTTIAGGFSRAEFSILCERRCKRAYLRRHAWFVRMVSATDNSGRDDLYVKTDEWLKQYREAPAVFRRESK